MTDIWDEKPNKHSVMFMGKTVYFYDVKEVDAWLDKLMMDYEDRLLKMRGKIEELLSDIGAAQGFKVFSSISTTIKENGK